MNERTKNKVIIVLFLILALVIYIVVTFTTPAAANERSLSAAIIRQTAGDVVSLNDLTDFEWDYAYTFAPYTALETICDTIGFDTKASLETVSESMVQMIFTKEEEVVCVLLGHPDKLGYDFDYNNSNFDDYLVFSSQEDPQFRIERPYTHVLRLKYLPLREEQA